MKYNLPFLLFLALSSSCDIGKTSPKSVGDNEFITSPFCIESPSKPFSEKISLVRMCHFLINDSVGEEYSEAYGNGRLPTFFNFDRGDQPLVYTLVEDTIHVRMLVLSPYEPRRISLDTVYSLGDTIYFNEKWDALHQVLRKDLRYEEIVYDFIVDNPTKKFFFKYRYLR